PLIVLPKVWRGSPTELEEPHTSAVARLVERHGPATEARAATRTVNVTDRLLVLARPGRDVAGRPRLEPPDGGYLLTNLALDDAMRLLGGRNRRLVRAAIVGVALSVALVVVGALGLVAPTIGVSAHVYPGKRGSWSDAKSFMPGKGDRLGPVDASENTLAAFFAPDRADSEVNRMGRQRAPLRPSHRVWCR
ncbi:MAG TPA: hypothetical protein VF108_12180, partial [Actinomycetota bacterium]